MTGSYTGEARDPKHLKEPKHSTTVKNQNTAQQYCTVLLLVFVLLLVLLDFYSRISGMSSVDTWPKAVQNWLKAAHISPRSAGGSRSGSRARDSKASSRVWFWFRLGLLLTLASPASNHLRQSGRLHIIASRDLHQDFD